MLQIRKRVKAFFADPVKELAILLIELRHLKLDLKFAAELHDPLEAIVVFFESVSKWHDRDRARPLGGIIAAFEDVNYGQHDEVLERLRALELHFENAGRRESGWNRTERGETVTEDSVYLGNIWGLWTKTVRYWKTYKGRPDQTASNGRPVYEVISNQAREFMDSHIGPMTRIIDELESVARAKAA